MQSGEISVEAPRAQTKDDYNFNYPENLKAETVPTVETQ